MKKCVKVLLMSVALLIVSLPAAQASDLGDAIAGAICGPTGGTYALSKTAATNWPTASISGTKIVSDSSYTYHNTFAKAGNADNGTCSYWFYDSLFKLCYTAPVTKSGSTLSTGVYKNVTCP